MYVDYNRVYSLHAKLLAKIAANRQIVGNETEVLLYQAALIILRWIEQKIHYGMMLDPEDVAFIQQMEDQLS